MRVPAIIIAGILLTGGIGSAAVSKAGAKALPIVNIVATADQKFVPDHIVLHVGKTQTLRFSSTGGVHGVASTDLGLPSTMISADKPVSVSVTPTKAGSYPIRCSIVCGPNHADMLLTAQVKP